MANRLPYRRPGAATVVPVALALAGLIVLAAQGDTMWSQPRVGQPNRLAMLTGLGVLWTVGFLVAGALTVVATRSVSAVHPDHGHLRTDALRALAPTTVALTIVSLLAIANADLGPAGASGEPRATAMDPLPGRYAAPWEMVGWWSFPVMANPRDSEEPEGIPPPVRSDLPSWLALIGLLSLMVAFVAWRYWSHGKGDGATGQEGSRDKRRESFHGTVLGTIDAMLGDPDPHTAIIGAYARLLEGLAACGVARRDHEGPMEHLHRALGVLRVRPRPSRRLVHLFSLARFSTHALDESHRDQALSSLGAVAEDLAITSTDSPFRPYATRAGPGR